MPERKVTIQNGINQQLTQTQNGNTSWWACNLIRYRDGMVERIGGWQRLFAQAVAGVVRQFHAYEDLNLIAELIIAGDGGLQIWNSSVGLNTVQVVGAPVSVPQASLTTVAGSSTVTVSSPAHGRTVGNKIFLNITMSLGGITYYPAPYIIKTVPSAGVYTIATPSAALTTASGTLPYIAPVPFISFVATSAQNELTAAVRGGNSSIVGANAGDIAYHASTTFNWTELGALVFPAEEITGATYGNSTFVMSSSSGVVKASTDGGATWNARTSGITSAQCAAFGNGVWIVAGNNGQLTTTSNANAANPWTVQASAAAAFGASAIKGVTYGSLYVAAGIGGKIATSPDAITWTARTSGVIEDFVDIAYGNGLYVAICNSGVYVYSSDGITWTASNINTLGRSAITFGNGVFVTVGEGALISTSTDAVTWTRQSSSSYGNPGPLDCACFGDGLFMIGGRFGRFLYSSDGIDWWWPAQVTLIGSNFNTSNTFTFQVPTSVGSSSGGGSTPIVFSGTYKVRASLSADVFVIDAGIQVIQSIPAYENNGNQLVYYDQSSMMSTNWSLDNLGNNAMINPAGGPLYVWTPPLTLTSAGLNYAINVPTASQINTAMLVAMPQAQVITLGSQPIIGTGAADPLFLRFSDAGGYTNWIASSTNQAGSYRLSRGSRIIGGIQLALVTLVFTDLDVWSMQYVGPPFVYSFNILSSNSGLIAQNAVGILNSTAYWMGVKQFYRVSSGGAQGVPCPVWDIIFNDLDQANLSKIFCATNSSYNEIAWFYPSVSGGTGECDKYVMLQTDVPNNMGWSYGTLTRSAWHDSSPIGNPVGADGNLHIQQHDIGYNDDGAPMVGAFAETGLADQADGDVIPSINEIIPDIKWFGTNPGAVEVTLKGASYPQGVVISKGPFGMDMNNRHIRPRMRKRFIGLRWDWIARLDYNARIGSFRVKTQPSGRRP